MMPVRLKLGAPWSSIKPLPLSHCIPIPYLLNSWQQYLYALFLAEVPPECSPATISQTVSERKPVNFCIQEVRCIDKTGGGQLELISTTGDGMDYLEIKIRKEEQQLLLSACIKESLEGRFGTYQVFKQNIRINLQFPKAST